MTMFKNLILAGVALGAMAVSAVAAEPPMPQVVTSWNSLPYLLSPEAKAAWEASPAYGKALLHGVKVDASDNIYVTTARWGSPDIPATLSKLVKQGDGYMLQPFPSEGANSVKDRQGLKAVLGFEIDRNDVMWILDQGHIAGKPSKPGDEKLVLWDIKAGKELQRYEFSDAEADQKCSFLNDVVVDNDTDFAYITDSGIFCNPLRGGLIVYDRKANKARRILGDSPLTNPEPGFSFKVDGRTVLEKSPMLTGADGIALSGDKKTLYWTNLTGHTLYALDTAMLRDFSISEDKIAAAVRTVTTLPSNTDGMVSDADGNLYMSALGLNGLTRRDAKTGEVKQIAESSKMVWPDTLGWGPGGALYFSTNHLHLWVDDAMNFKNPANPNFTIWKLDLKDKSYTAR